MKLGASWKRIGVAVGLLTVSVTAWAFPWDIDMTDSTMLRAYEWKMMELPEGAVSRNNYRQPYVKGADAETLVNPMAGNPERIEQGKKLFNIYCIACHGPDGRGGAPVADMSTRKRYPFPPPFLSGPGAITALRSDGNIFMTVRNGNAIMPKYNAALFDNEIWSIIAYIRTMDGATPPPPAAESTAPGAHP